MYWELKRSVKILLNRGFVEFLKSLELYLNQKYPILLYISWLLRGKLLTKHDDKFCLEKLHTGETKYFPHKSDAIRFFKKRQDSKEKKYYDSSIARLEKGDVVFDVGAYIGLTSIIAAKRAKKVYAIEPSPRARECLKKNIDGYDNIEILPYAAWNKSEELRLQYGQSVNNDSLITPDDGGIKKTMTVQAHTIKKILEEKNIESVDFLKIEAEGVEPEIVEGINGGNIQKVVSTGNDERFGQNVYEDVAAILRDYGYEVHVDEHHSSKMVYAYAKK